MPNSNVLDLDGPVHLVHHGGHGRPILLIHGLGGSHVNWSAVAEPLTAYGAVTAIDLIGFGRTPPAERSSGVSAQRDLVIAYLRQYADAPAVLIGNSMGGLISMLVAKEAPELVESLVLVDSALPVVRPRIDADVLRRLALPLVPVLGPRSARDRYDKATATPDAFIDELYEVLFADPSRVRPQDRAKAVAMFRERMTMPWAGDAFTDAARSIFNIVARGGRFARRVSEIEAPALIVHGDSDRLVDVASARWLSRRRPDWRLEVLEDVGHVPQLEVPDQFLDIVGGWLADNAMSAAG